MRIIRKVLIGIAFSGLLGSNIALVFSGSYLTSITDLLRNTPLTSYLDDSLVVKNRKLKAQTLDAKQRLHDQRTKSSKITRNIARRTTLSVTRNTGAAFVEALPGIGIATIIGMTAWDIKDGCDTLTEINSLLDELGEPTDLDQTKICGMQAPSQDEIIESVIVKRDEWLSDIKELF